MFEKVVGNSQIKDYLSRMLAKNALSHSLLFAGPEGVGKILFARALAEHLLGSPHHPDLHVYHPEGKTGMHSLTAVRQLSEEVYLAPFSGKQKVFILDDADRMLSSSANALLKTFEEPAEDSLIILISSNPSALLPTILSRCFSLFFQPLTEEEIISLLENQWQVSPDKAAQISFQAQGSMSRALRLLDQEEKKLRTLILNRLSLSRSSSYQDVNTFSQKIAADLEEAQSLWEKEAKDKLFQGAENMNATQKQTLEKECEGIVAMKLMHEFQGILDLILGWYRDMHLIKVNGPRAYLIHRDFEAEIEQALQRGELEPLENIQKILADAKLALERSTSLFICMENLFLRLKFNS
jgi:DNA polymerase III subunit delta'